VLRCATPPHVANRSGRALPSLRRLQQLVVEHVLSESQRGLSTVNTSSAPAASDLVARIDASNCVSPAHDLPSDPEVVRSTEPEPVPVAPASTQAESGAPLSDPLDATPPPPKEVPSPFPTPTASTDSPFSDSPPEETGATTADRIALTPAAANSRAGRYLNRPASAPARHVTNQELHRLSRLRDVGDVARLVLQFGV